MSSVWYNSSSGKSEEGPHDVNSDSGGSKSSNSTSFLGLTSLLATATKSSKTAYKSGRYGHHAVVSDGDDEKAYLFSRDSSSEDDKDSKRKDLNVGFELRERTSTHSPSKKTKKVQPYYDDERKAKGYHEQIILREIESGDTLQNLSLKCGVSIAEIKRVNNLITEQEFYGLKYIKIPVKRYGILTEVLVHQVNTSNCYPPPDLLTGEHLSEVSSTTNLNAAKAEHEPNHLVVGVGLRRTFNSDESTTDVKKFISNLDKDLEEIRSVATNYSKPFSATDQTENKSDELTRTVLSSTKTQSRSSLLYCDGADCGLPWWHLLCFAAVLLILVPVIYVFVVEEQQMSNHTHHHLHGNERHSFNVPFAHHSKDKIT